MHVRGADNTPTTIRVSCVGDSITYGVGTPDPATQSYPAQLQAILGASWCVTNFGVGGRTLIRKADPLAFGRALRSEPNAVVLCLGTNDSKPYCWDRFSDDFIPDYTNAIAAFQALPSKPHVFVCLPPPAFPGNWGISDARITSDIIPRLKTIAESTGSTLIDLNTPLRDSKALFPDTVHPNIEGAHRLAEIVAAALQEKRDSLHP